MAKNYLVCFGGSAITGLSPTFSLFKALPSGGNTTPPGITEIPTTSGLYYFNYAPAGPVAFIIDGATTGLPGLSRYVVGSLDPIDAANEGITALAGGISGLAAGLTLVGGLGISALAVLGTTASSFGSTATDPATVIGYLKRLMEFNEGNNVFTKSSGIWDVYARSNATGASTQLAQKTVTDSGSVITKL